MRKESIIIGIVMLIMSAWILAMAAYAQTTSVPTTIADAGVVLTQQSIDQIEADKASKQTQISSLQNKVGLINGQITDLQNQIATDDTNEQQLQQSLLALASQATPLDSAVNICNSNASVYCPGWVVK